MKKYVCIAGFLSAFLLVLGSCTEIFSTSLAPWAARDPKTLVPKVTADNVDEIIDSAQNNPDLSLQVLKGIEDAVNGATNPDDVAALQAAALEAAANATALGASLLNQIKDAPDAINSEEAAINLLLNTINGMQNLNESADALEVLLPDPKDTEAWDAFIAKSTPEDLATAAVIIIAGEAKKVMKDGGDGGEYLFAGIDPDHPDTTAHEKLSLALALSAAADDGIDGSLNQFLQKIKLVNDDGNGSQPGGGTGNGGDDGGGSDGDGEETPAGSAEGDGGEGAEGDGGDGP